MSDDLANGSDLLPPGWITTPLGNVLRVIRGVTYKKQDSSTAPKDGMIPVLRATNIGEGLSFDQLVYVPPDCVSEYQLLRFGDVVIAASSGSKKVVGKAALFSHDWKGSFGAFCYGLRPDALIDPKFVAFFLQTTRYRNYVSEAAAGVNINNLRREHIEDFTIPIAPRPAQGRITAEIEKQFSRLDAGVAALRRVEANLKRYKAAVLKAACTGALTADWRAAHPDVEPASKLLDRILHERRRRWEEAELAKMTSKGKLPKDDKWKAKYKEPVAPVDNGSPPLPPLPESWCWATVSQLSHLVQYGSSAKCSVEGPGVPVLRMGNITVDGRIDMTALKYLPEAHDEFPALLLTPQDLLFNRTNSAELVGKSAVYDGEPVCCSFASYLIRVRCLNGAASKYLAACLNSAYGRAWIRSVVSQQVGQANVNGTKLGAFAVPLPPVDEQFEIVQQLEAAMTTIQATELAIEKEIRRSGRLRQSILKDAFEGNLVEQDPTDEPASVLLERIRAERAGQELVTSRRGSKKPPKRRKKAGKRASTETA